MAMENGTFNTIGGGGGGNEHDGGISINPIHDEFWEEHCSVITPEESRFIMVGVVGSLVAIISVIFNTFLFTILISSRNNRYSQLLYLIFLAFSDIFLSASYILMFPVNIFMDYFQNEFMSTAWFSYVKYVFSTCHITMTGSALLITLATFERFLTVKKIKNNFTMAHRIILTVIVFFFALLAKGPLFWELAVENNYNCTGVTAYIVGFNEFAKEEPYKTFYTFWFRCLISTFLPFFLSFYFNIQIVLQLRRQQVGARLFRFGISEHRHNIRSATRMLVLVTCTYLASNLLNVVVATWEAFDSEFLTSENIRPYYTISSDLISLLTVLACALRLPIYYACNQRIRQEVNLKLSKMCFCRNYFDRFQLDYTPTMRYLNSGNGYVIRRNKSKMVSQNQENQSFNVQQGNEKCIGTGLDKIVLSVAMNNSITSTSNETK